MRYCTNRVISYSKLVRAGVSYSIVAAKRLLGGGSLIPTADGMRPRCTYSTVQTYTRSARSSMSVMPHFVCASPSSCYMVDFLGITTCTSGYLLEGKVGIHQSSDK